MLSTHLQSWEDGHHALSHFLPAHREGTHGLAGLGRVYSWNTLVEVRQGEQLGGALVDDAGGLHEGAVLPLQPSGHGQKKGAVSSQPAAPHLTHP